MDTPSAPSVFVSSKSIRPQITLTSPSKNATLDIDKQYRSVQLSALFNYVETLIADGVAGNANNLIYLMKFNREIRNDTGKVTSLIFDLVDIRKGASMRSPSFMESNPAAAELGQIRRVFVSNMFFVSRYLLNMRVIPAAGLVEFSNVHRVKGMQSDSEFYAWDSTIVTRPEKIQRGMTAWNARDQNFESSAAADFGFIYELSDGSDSVEEEEEEEEEIKAPKVVPPAKRRFGVRGKK